MKKTNLQDIKELDIKSIWLKIASAKKQLRDLILDKNTNKLKDTSVLKKKKKDIAQMLTVLAQKRLLKELEQKVAQAEPVRKEESKSLSSKTLRRT